MNNTIQSLVFGKRTITLVGTAHISAASIEDTRSAIETYLPDRVCVELDDLRYERIIKGDVLKSLDILKVLRQKRGALLFINLLLSSYQQRLGKDMAIAPGSELKEAIDVAKERNIPVSMCDRNISVTFRRAWRLSSLWSRIKTLSYLLAAMMSRQKVSAEDIEELKKNSMHGQAIEQMAKAIPTIKKVLIDERDLFLAKKIFAQKEANIVAVVGLGHVPGIKKHLEAIYRKEIDTSVSELEQIPSPSILEKLSPWIFTALLASLLLIGIIRTDFELVLSKVWLWIFINGGLASIGAILALGHPVSIIAAFFIAPFTSTTPLIGAGTVIAIIEASIRKPRVIDLENLHQDFTSIRGFYRNRLTRALLVFVLSGTLSAIGTFVATALIFT